MFSLSADNGRLTFRVIQLYSFYFSLPDVLVQTVSFCTEGSCCTPAGFTIAGMGPFGDHGIKQEKAFQVTSGKF